MKRILPFCYRYILLILLISVGFVINDLLGYFLTNVAWSLRVSTLWSETGVSWANNQDAGVLNISFQRALQISPLNYRAWRGLGYELYQGGAEELAVTAWQHVPNMGQELIDWGIQSRKSENTIAARQWFRQATYFTDVAPFAWYEIGLLRAEQNELEHAIDALHTSIELDPDYRDAWFELGIIYEKTQNWELANESFNQGLSATTGVVGLSDIYFRLGKLYQLAPPWQDDLKAWIAYEQALTVDDYAFGLWNKAETYRFRGQILAAGGHWEAAVREYQTALQIKPRNYWCLISLSIAEWNLLHKEEAFRYLGSAIAEYPERKSGYLQLAKFYVEENNLPAAKRVYCRIRELDPKDQEMKAALNKLGHCMAK